MKHRPSLRKDQTKPAADTALSLALPSSPKVGAWHTLLSSFPYLALNRHAGRPVPGTEFVAKQETPVTWSGPRGMGWAVHEAIGQAVPIHVASNGHDTASRQSASEKPLSDTPVSSSKETLLRPMFPALALMVPAPGKDKRARALSRPAKISAPALHGLLRETVRSTPVPETRRRLGVAPDERQREKHVAMDDVPTTALSDACLNGSKKTMQAREEHAVPIGIPAQETPVPLPQGSIVQRMGEVLAARQTRPRASLTYPTRGDVPRNTANAASVMVDAPLKASAFVVQPGMPALPSGAADVLPKTPHRSTSRLSHSAMPRNAANAASSMVDAPLKASTFVVPPGMPALSSGAADAPSMPELLSQGRRGADLQVLASLADSLEGRVQENVKRIVEKKLEQLSPPVTQSQSQNASVEVDTTALVGDDVVHVLMKKMLELAEEARFRSGRLR